MATRLAHRVALSLVAATLGLVSGASGASGASGEPLATPLSVRVTCGRADEPGRVRCDAEVKPPPGATLRWVDLVLVATPAFAAPLRGRVGPEEAAPGGPLGYTFPFALVARGAGVGALGVRARAVVCAAEACRSVATEASTEVVVGRR